MIKVSNKLQVETNFLTTGLSSDARSAAANGDSIDLESLFPEGPHEAGLLMVEIEGFTGSPTAQDIKFTVEHSDDDSTFTQVTDSAVIEAESLDFDDVGIKTLAFRLPSMKRYVRARLDAATFTGGSSPKAKVRAFFVLSEPRQV